MNLVSLRVITDDITRLVGFYEHITGRALTWYTDDFAELTTAAGTLAISDDRRRLNQADNRTASVVALHRLVAAETGTT